MRRLTLPPANLRRRAILIGALGLGLIVGCGARAGIGADDLEGTAGAAGTAGAGAGDTTSGPVTGGTGGAGTTSGTAGTGGVDPTTEAILDACVVGASCRGGAGWAGLSASACVDAFARLGWRYERPDTLVDPTLIDRLLQCAKVPVDCAAFHQCFGGDWFTLSRCQMAQCDGNSLAAEQEGPFFDCGSIGTTCQDLWSNAPRACCNVEPCSQGSEAIECNGTVATLCGGWGEHITFDCGVSGQSCVTEPEMAFVPCAGDAPCGDLMDFQCEGDTAVWCSGGGVVKYDCNETTFRTRCNQGGPPWDMPCIPEYNECNPEGGDACDGDSLVACVNGAMVATSCTALGFSGCDPTGTPRCVF